MYAPAVVFIERIRFMTRGKSGVVERFECVAGEQGKRCPHCSFVSIFLGTPVWRAQAHFRYEQSLRVGGCAKPDWLPLLLLFGGDRLSSLRPLSVPTLRHSPCAGAHSAAVLVLGKVSRE